MLPRAFRLCRPRDFQSVYRTRKCWTTPCLALHVRSSNSGTRFGFVISTKTAKRAHDRNLLKRRMREICRAYLRSKITQVDIVFVARVPALALDYQGLASEIRMLLHQAGLVEAEDKGEACGTF